MEILDTSRSSAVTNDTRANNSPTENAWAIAGFVCSLFANPMLGIIFSCLGLRDAKKLPNREGFGFAVAGLVISIFSIILIIAYVVLLIVIIICAMHETPVYVDYAPIIGA
jgi:hypothetical protein